MSTLLLSTDRQQSVMGGLPPIPRAYSPYGVMKASVEPVVGFCGQYRDSLTGQYLLGKGRRAYSPSLMRFLSPDRLSPFDKGGLNTYAYCSGDPINRIDPDAQSWQPVVGAASSLVTAAGAIFRTSKNEALRLQDRYLISQGMPSTYTEPPLTSRIGNTLFAATGTTGITANLLAGAESGWADGSLISVSTGFGLANSGGNIAGGITSNFNAARETWALMGQPGIPSSSVVFGTFVEVTGIRMMGEAMSYVGRTSAYWAGRIANTVRGAYQGWQSSGDRDIQMEDVRRS
ncbi:MAG: RHS repeat-associated core domain-containing protein [Pseudomonas sp.]